MPVCRPSPEGGCIQHGPECGEPGKRPLVPYKRARTTWGQILKPLIDQPPNQTELRYWFDRWPDCNLAVIVPPGFVVLDVDRRNFGDETAYRLGLTHVATVTHNTPGGQHLFLQADAPSYSILGPGVEVLGPGHLCNVPPSIGINGLEYSAEYDFGEVEIALWPKTAPYWGTAGSGGIACGGFWSNAVEDCLVANEYSLDEVVDPEQIARAMSEVEANGVPEGRRFLSLKGVLRWRWELGASSAELEEIGLAFCDRCQPHFKEGATLIKWVLALVRREEAEAARSEPATDETVTKESGRPAGDESKESQRGRAEDPKGDSEADSSPKKRQLFRMLLRAGGVILAPETKLYACPFGDHDRPALNVDLQEMAWGCSECKKGGGIEALAIAIGRTDFHWRGSVINLPLPMRDQVSGRILTQGRIPRSALSEWRTLDPVDQYKLDICGKGSQVLVSGREGVRHRFMCERYDCDRCGPYLKWTRWILPVVERSGGDFYAKMLDPSEKWKNVYQRLYRRKIQYALIKSLIGEMLVTSVGFEGAVKVEEPVRFLDAIIPDTSETGCVDSSHGWKVTNDEERPAGTGNGDEPAWAMLTLTGLPENEIDLVAQDQGLIVEEGGIYQVPEGKPAPKAWADFRLALKARELEIKTQSEERKEGKSRGNWRNRRVGRVRFDRADDVGMAAD